MSKPVARCPEFGKPCVKKTPYEWCKQSNKPCLGNFYNNKIAKEIEDRCNPCYDCPDADQCINTSKP